MKLSFILSHMIKKINKYLSKRLVFSSLLVYNFLYERLVMKRFGKFVMIAAMAMASYSASAELEPQWSKGTVIANAGVGVSPFDKII